MKTTLIACLLLCFSMASAQSDLFVSNGSYIYVDGTGFSSGTDVAPLFVTNDVNLENNSHIYLRNDAQLLQGNNVGNSGTGELSVYQNGTVNQWAYNYWCAPVGGILTDNFVNNAFRVNQIDDPLLGTPDIIDSSDSAFTTAYNGTADPLLISTRWLWMFVSSNQYSQWIPAATPGNANIDITPGLGFTMKGSGTGTTGNTTYDFRGKPNNGTIGSPVAADQFTLVGNPYPSAMDAAAFIHDADNINAIEATLFYWEQDGSVASHVLQDYVGGYSEFTINPAGTVITTAPAVFNTYDEQDNVLPLPPPGANGSKLARRYIPIGQGFMIEGKTGSTGTVQAKNAHRVYEKEGADSYFFRTSNPGLSYQENGLSEVPDDYKRFRINIDFTVDENQYTRQVILNFHDSATPGHDRGLEPKRSQSYNSDVYFILDNKQYSGQAYAFDQALIIPLVVDIEEQQPLRFRIFDIQNFDESQGIYIHDIYNDVYVNLRDQDYELNIEPGNYTDRFKIVFTPGQALSIDDLEVSDLTIRQDNDIHELSVINPNGLDVKTIEVFDMAGKRMLNQFYDSISNHYQLSTVDLSDGVYIVNVTSIDNTVKTEKIIVKH